MDKCKRLETEKIPSPPDSGQNDLQGFQTDWVIGLSKEEAEKIIKNHGKYMCIIVKELMKYDYVKKYDSHRVKIKIANRKVTHAEVG